MKDDKTKRKQKIMKFLAISSIVVSLVLSSIALHNSSDLDELKSGVHGQLWIGNDYVFFIADDSSLGLEMYAWAHGEMSNEWIIIH